MKSVLSNIPVRKNYYNSYDNPDYYDEYHDRHGLIFFYSVFYSSIGDKNEILFSVRKKDFDKLNKSGIFDIICLRPDIQEIFYEKHKR